MRRGGAATARGSRPAAVVVALAVAALVAGAGCGGAAPRRTAPPGDPLRMVPADTLYRQGMALAADGDMIRAEEYLAASIDRGYPARRALPPLLRVCLASSRLRAALSYAEPYLERHPGAWSLRYLVASIYLGVGEVDRARTALEQVIVDAPRQPDAYYLLGVVLRDKVGDRQAAALRFQRYLELAPHGEHEAEARAALAALTRPEIPLSPTPADSSATDQGPQPPVTREEKAP